MSGMLQEERFDGMLLQFAQQCQGIEPLLDTLFSFLRRKTDFFNGAKDDQAKSTVLRMLEKHQALADRTKAEKEKVSAAAEAKAAERKAAAKAKREAAKAKAATAPAPAPPAPKADDAVEVGKNGADLDAATSSNGEEKEKKDGDDDDDDKEPPPPGNGGIMPWGIWTQQLADLELKIPMPPDTKAKHLIVDIQKAKIKVGVKGQPPALEGELHKRVIIDDCFWTLEDVPGAEDGSKEIVIALQKEDKQNWWKCVIVGDPEINTQKVQPENSKLGDLDGETRMTVEKMMYDQRQKAMGKPTSEEAGKQDVLEKFMKAHPEMDFSKAKFN